MRSWPVALAFFASSTATAGRLPPRTTRQISTTATGNLTEQIGASLSSAKAWRCDEVTGGRVGPPVPCQHGFSGLTVSAEFAKAGVPKFARKSRDCQTVGQGHGDRILPHRRALRTFPPNSRQHRSTRIPSAAKACRLQEASGLQASVAWQELSFAAKESCAWPRRARRVPDG